VLDDEVLGNHATHGEGEDVDRVATERGDECVGIIGSLLKGCRNTAGGGVDAALVEGDDMAGLGDGVDDARRPLRGSISGAVPLVREARPRWGSARRGSDATVLTALASAKTT